MRASTTIRRMQMQGMTAKRQVQARSFFDSDEDEPITLSDEELDGILSCSEEEHKHGAKEYA